MQCNAAVSDEECDAGCNCKGGQELGRFSYAAQKALKFATVCSPRISRGGEESRNMRNPQSVLLAVGVDGVVGVSVSVSK